MSRFGFLPHVIGAALQPWAVLQIASCLVLTTCSAAADVQCVTVLVRHPTPLLVVVAAAPRVVDEGFAVATVPGA